MRAVSPRFMSMRGANSDPIDSNKMLSPFNLPARHDLKRFMRELGLQTRRVR